MNFSKVIDQVVGFLEQRGTPFSLVGGLALQAYGAGRAMDFETYLATLAQLPQPTMDALRNRSGPAKGPPFTLS